MKTKLILLKRNFLILLIIISAYPRGKGLYYASYSNYYSREYGNGIIINLALPIILILFILALLKKKKVHIDNSMIVFCLFAIISIIFPNSKNIHVSIIGIIEILKYTILYWTIIQLFRLNDLKKCFYTGFGISLLIQTVLGLLYVFKQIGIPGVSDYGDAGIRNNTIRMFGTFPHDGDFALYIAIIFTFFACDYYFHKRRKSLILTLVAALDLFYSGSRTTMIIGIIILAGIILQRYKKSIVIKLGFIFLTIFLLVIFSKTKTFYNIFIISSFTDMFRARYIHWIMGWKIFTMNYNWILGCGINNIVDSINSNYSIIMQDIIVENAMTNDFLHTMPIHNSFIIMLDECGILGFILYVRLYYINLKSCILIMRSKIKLYMMESLFILFSLIVYIIYGIQGWAMLKDPAWIIFTLIIAFSCIQKKDFYTNHNSSNLLRHVEKN